MKAKASSIVLVGLMGAILPLAGCSSSSDAEPSGQGGGNPSGPLSDSGAGSDAVADAADASDGSPIDAPSCTATDILGKLKCIPGLTVTEAVTDSGATTGLRRFDMVLDQPVDHDNPAGQHFGQRLMLLHRDESSPMVLASSGYTLGTGQSELTRTFPTNQIQVEHRYFAPSAPDPLDWKMLNIKQSAGDYHAIVTAFKSIYKGKWVNTGASKGGMTSIYHRRFFPTDLDATVAYVAPNMFGLEDARFVTFLQAVGGDTYADCRAKMKELQKTVLTRRDELEPSMPGTYDSLGGKDIAIEHAVLEMPFTFWQYQSPTSATTGCSAIPAPDAPQATLFSFFQTVTSLSNYGDSGFDYYAPYYYQAATQLGAPGVDDADILGLLRHRETYKPSSYIPKGVDATFDADAMVDVQNWVKAEGKTIMFIYGEFDPWSSGKFEIGSGEGNYVFTAPGANHGANLARLASADRTQALGVLQTWFGVAPTSIQPLLPEQSHQGDELEVRRPRL